MWVFEEKGNCILLKHLEWTHFDTRKIHFYLLILKSSKLNNHVQEAHCMFCSQDDIFGKQYSLQSYRHNSQLPDIHIYLNLIIFSWWLTNYYRKLNISMQNHKLSNHTDMVYMYRKWKSAFLHKHTILFKARSLSVSIYRIYHKISGHFSQKC